MRIAAEIDDALVLSTTEVGRRLGIPLTGTFLRSMGLQPYAVLPNGVFWLQDDLPAIRDAMVAYLQARPV